MKNYDDLIPEAPAEQPAARGGNKYDEIISAPDTPDVRATAVSLSALSRNPELSAKARTLGQRYGLPVDVIERNLPELEKRAQQDTNDAVLQRSPLLSRFIGADPDRAAVAIDDLPTFGEIERNLGAPFPRRRTLTGAFRDASAEARREADRFGRALKGARRGGQVAETPVDYSIVDRVRYGYGQARAGLPIAMNELTGLYDGDQFGLALAISDRLRDAERANLATPPAAVAEGARAVGEAEGFLESGVAVLGSPAFVLDTVFTSLGQSAPSMLAGLAGSAAGPAGQAIGAGAGSLAVEYSASLIDSIREAGLTPTNAQEVYRALTDPALMDQAREKALKRGVAIATFDALTAGLAGNILRNARGASRTAMAAAVAGEAGLQAAGGAGGELVAQLLTESSVKWGEVFLEGIAEIATGAVEVPSNLRAAREAAEARFARNDHSAMLAEYHAHQVKQVSELVSATKVLARDPRTLQEFIDSVAVEGGRVEDIYVDARQFAQAVGEEKLAELRQASPSVAAQIDEAIAIGGDLVVPLGEFATTIGQSDVMPSVLELIRPDAAEMSLAEAKQFAQARDEQMLAEAERALEEAGEASEFTRSARSVEQRLLEELQTANRFTEAVNTRYAKLVSAFFTTMAKRTGVLPEQFAERYKLRVRNEAVQGGRRMEQITPEQAMATNVPVELPNDPIFAEAVGNTSGAEITENGLLIDLVRFQKPEQEGAQAIRTGVFYLPAKSENVRHYKTTPSTKFPNPYGGSERMEGATLLRRPLFVKGATGGKAPEAAYDAIKGKGAMKSLDRAVMDVVTSRGFMTRTDPEAFLRRVEQFLGEWGGDRGLADEIIRNSTQGNTLRYALQEHVIAHAVREAGYDAVVGYSKGKAGARISEVFDVREQTFPARGMDSEVHSAFNQSAFTADTFDPTVASILAQPVTTPTSVENFKPGSLHTLLGREDWTILTAHNPMGQQLSPEENAARNERLREELDRRGLDYIDSIGKYVNDILADPPEDGFAVFGVTPEIANEIGNMFEQDSVLTGRGLLYHDMTLNPADGTITEHATPPENYFTSIPQTGALFTMGINFEQRIPFVRQFAQPADRGRVDNVAVVHYSQQPRASLVSWFYGTGMKGAEYERVMSASDTRLRQRIHFYVSAGQPIVPESGVGRAAHVTTVSNLYDADLDHLKLRRQSRGDANAFESAILDAGYDGYLSRTVFGRQGTVVMLGRRDLRVEQVSDPDTRLAIPPAPLFTEGEILAREIAAHRALPSGSGKLDWWQGYLPKVVPDLAAKIPDGAWDRMRAAFGDADIYRSDLARLFDAPEIGRSFAQTVSTRPALNSNGQRIAQTEEGLRNFWRWFGDSKVREPMVSSKQKFEGMPPLVVYHATNTDITAFEAGRETFNSTTFGDVATTRAGIFFAEDPKFAEAYLRTGPGKNVMPVYLSIKNPLYLDDGISGDDLTKILKHADPQKLNANDFRYVKIDQWWTAFDDEFGAEFVRAARAAGFDGAYMLERNPDDAEDGNDYGVWVAFSPEQIKSATGNRGTFDPADPKILNQSAYHGTPHRFDRFSLAHLGTGEGVQAFGWGLYFTSDRNIAEWYRRKLSDDQAVASWRIGSRYLVRDEQFQDYSPRNANSDAEQAWATAAEGLLLAEAELRDTLYTGGDVRAKAAEVLDELVEMEKSGDYRKGFVAQLERIRDQARDGMVFELTEPQGQLYQVNIPEESEMLAWDKPLSEQPEKVREALAAADPENYQEDADEYDAAEEGAMIYQRLMSIHGGDEAASKYLNSIGVRGISYQADGGRTDARNFVVFDDTAIEVLNTFYQQQQALRGQITFGEDITRTPSVISLFEQANLSTFLHESGHFFLEVMADVAARGESAQVADDMNKILRWFGVPDLETWRAMSPDQQRPHHERFARGFERYLMEGRAPSRALEGLFASFRSWLLSVYRALIGSAGGADAALNVSVSDEVRQVMDRLIATDEEIAEAQDSRRYAPLFKSAEEMGATPAEWAAYQREHGDALEAAQAELGARSLREMRWLSGAKSRELKRLQAEAKAARAAVEEEARAEVRAEPVYAAMRWLKHGEMVGPDGEQIKALSGFKLDIDAVRVILAAAGLDTSVLGVGKYGMAGKDGLAPQVVAEMFGFPNGETLIHAIVGATPEADAVEALTDQRMLERYGELVDDRAMERAADAAVHNEARGRFVAVELRALTRALNKQARTPAGGSVNALARAARELADRIVLRKPIKDIKPAKFSAAEVRAAKAAEKALAGNDLTTAVTEKRNQMVNFYAARAAHNALGRFEVGLRKMKRALESDGIDQEYRDQIAAILDRYNLRPMTKKEQQRAKSLVAWVDAQKAAGYEPVIDEDVLNEARRVPVRDLTVEEFDGLVASAENIAHLGRLKKKLLTAKDAREFAARVAEAEEAIRDNATRTIPEQIEKGRLARFRSGVKEFFVMHRKFANTIFEMDGWRDGGALWELFVRPMNEAADREAVMREQATIRLAELFKAVSKDARRKVFIPEINTALTAEARIMVALNTGNAGNLQRLMDGDRWSIDQVKAITDTLTKEQWDFVQGVWDLIDEYRPMIAEQQKRITGVEPKWVEPTPVDTPHGVYRGGYFPAKYDTDRSTRSLSDEAAAGIMDQWRATRGAARTRDSFTKERAAKVIMRPLRKDFGVVTQHITEVTHRLAWQEYLIDATRLLNASQIDAAIREHYGPEVLRSMRDTIADVAAGEVGAQNAFEKAINHLRVGTTIVGLGWNLTTGLLQPIGLTQSMVRIGPKWVAKGLAQWLGNAARMESATAAIYEKSEFMRLRGKTMQREISEIRNTVSGTDSRLTASYFYFIQKLQIVADVPTWLGMYTKAIETMNVDEATAVALADQAVLDAQSGGQVKDLAAIQRGGPMLKLFTNFYSFFNTTFNLTRVAYGRTNFYKPGEAGLFLVDMLLLYTVPAVLGTLLKAALQGDTDDEDELAKKLIADQMNYLLGTMVGLREIGGATAAALGLPSGYSGPAGVRFFSEVQKLAKQVEQGEADAAFFKALNSSAGILFHYPAGQLNRTAEGVNAYLNGETENPAAVIVGPPR